MASTVFEVKVPRTKEQFEALTPYEKEIATMNSPQLKAEWERVTQDLLRRAKK